MDRGELIAKAAAQTFAKRVRVKGDGNLISGVLSEVGKIDLDGDRMMPGCFDLAIREFADGAVLPLKYFHLREEIIGRWTELAMSGKRLAGKAKINERLSRGSDAIELLKEELVTDLSIGFRARSTADLEWVDDASRNEWWGGGYDFKAVELVECSLVDVGAMPGAGVREIKALRDKMKSLAQAPDSPAKLSQLGGLDLAAHLLSTGG